MQPPGPGYPPPMQSPGGFQPPPVGAYPGYRPPPPTTTEAILSLVLSIVGMSMSCFPISLAAIYFGVKARRQAREQGDPNNTNGVLGLIGIILGGIFGAIWGLFWGFYGFVILAYVGVIIAAIVAGAASGP